jgi:hypothetical protein
MAVCYAAVVLSSRELVTDRMNSETTTFSYTPNQAEEYRATRLMSLRKPSTWGYFIVCGIGAAVLVSALILGRTGTLVISPMTEMVIVGALLLCLAALTALPYTWKQHVAHGWRDNPCAGEQVEVTVSPEGISFVTASGRAEMKWVSYRKVLETDEFLLLYFSAELAHVVPKRAMNGEQLQHVRDRVQRHLPMV